jgi:hypothetical protein
VCHIVIPVVIRPFSPVRAHVVFPLVMNYVCIKFEGVQYGCLVASTAFFL